MEIKKITLIFKSSVLFLIVLFIMSACDIVTVDEAEDSGFDLSVNNYSKVEYNNSIFYMGYKDEKGAFIATDSLVFKDIVIYKKGEGNDFNSENGFSSTHLLNKSVNGLNRFNLWAPNSKLESIYYQNEEIFFKVNLEGKTSISSPSTSLNGWIILTILEDGELVW